MIPNLKPINVKLMYCSKCQIHTNHHLTLSLEWVCWCGNVDEDVPEQVEREAAEIAEWLGME